MKKCSKCGVEKGLADFYATKGRPHAWCKKCHCAATADYYRRNRAAQNKRIAEVRRAKQLGLTPEQYRSLPSDPGVACSVCGAGPDSPRNGHFRRWSHDEPRKKNLAVDHDHKTGAVRGFLCSHCNRALGYMADDPILIRALADYVETGGLGWEPLPNQKPGRKRIRPPKEPRQPKRCAVAGCERPHYGHGWCCGHLRRYKRWGDPTAGRAENGTRRPRKTA